MLFLPLTVALHFKQPTDVLDIKHAGTAVVSITNDGSIEMKAQPSQNVHLTTFNGSKTVISDLELSHEHEYVHLEEVTVSHDIKSASVAVVSPTSGNFQVLMYSIVDDTVGRSSDCSVFAFMVKKENSANGLVSLLCSIDGDQNGNL